MSVVSYCCEETTGMDVSDAVGIRSLSEDVESERRPGSDVVRNELRQTSESSGEKDHMQRRLRTFANWLGLALPIQLSIAGFVFVGSEDKVQCESCKLKIGNWKKEDIPLDVHRIYSPDCSFLRKWFPVVKQPSESALKTGYDATKAKYQAFVTFTKRVASFDAWPLKLDIHSSTNMSLAGFLYIGSADRARCFYCGLTLRDWDTDDDPFKAHLQWSPKCAYIIHTHEERLKKELKPSPKPVSQVAADKDTRTSGGCKSGVLHREHSSMPFTSACSKHSTQVETVLTMGFSEEIIHKAIARRFETTGDDFPNAVSLFCAVEAIATNMG